MKVYSAIMLDENEVADHNCPTLLLADNESILLSKIRDWIKENSAWMDALAVNSAAVDTMSLEDINEQLCDNDPSLFVHTDCTDIS